MVDLQETAPRGDAHPSRDQKQRVWTVFLAFTRASVGIIVSSIIIVASFLVAMSPSSPDLSTSAVNQVLKTPGALMVSGAANSLVVGVVALIAPSSSFRPRQKSQGS